MRWRDDAACFGTDAEIWFPRFSDWQAAYPKAEAICAEAAEKGARVVVFPEGALTGSLHYLPAGTDLVERAVTVPGPETERLARLAAKLDLGIVMCTVEPFWPRSFLTAASSEVSSVDSPAIAEMMSPERTPRRQAGVP